MEESLVFRVLCLLCFVSVYGSEGDDHKSVTCRVERFLSGQGFHRELTTNLVIHLRNDDQSLISCELLLLESLSSGFYIDRYQTNNAQEFGGPKVFSFDDIDLEKPEFLSPSLKVYVFSPLKIENDTLSASVTIPLHVRYHRPLDGESYLPVEVLAPEVFAACHPDVFWPVSFERILAPCSSDTSVNCTWTKLLTCSFSQDRLGFEVPVGNLGDFPLVALVTMLVIGTSVVVLVVAMLRGFSDSKIPSAAATKKQS